MKFKEGKIRGQNKGIIGKRSKNKPLGPPPSPKPMKSTERDRTAHFFISCINDAAKKLGIETLETGDKITAEWVNKVANKSGFGAFAKEKSDIVTTDTFDFVIFLDKNGLIDEE